ncbi:hypothetical protein BKA58DRAFT_387480 [Alternaria rosae]|uniref:uncharacterized protein n=1 Tax=Alternaria rosae TaxID=1187941 RepID=UPI001E8E8D86|nr:uncharacterized protein BKA58DRAFT_387480 [Alternaria rosae]KAH6868723.1 hypothetical protein BKA58DRAFT_387480 [Alternaria rosae]
MKITIHLLFALASSAASFSLHESRQTSCQPLGEHCLADPGDFPQDGCCKGFSCEQRRDPCFGILGPFKCYDMAAPDEECTTTRTK